MKTNLLVDSAIFAAFLIAFEPGLTGIAIHEWLSLALAATLVIHLVLHWDWVVAVGARYFRKLFHESRLNFLVDVFLLAAYVLVMLSGILISRSVIAVLGIQLAESPAWRFLHSWSANASLLLTGLHLALHWKWIVAAIKRFVVQPLTRGFEQSKSRPEAYETLAHTK
jgi:hypothetical protein